MTRTMTIHVPVPIRRRSYAWARRAQRVFFSIFLCLCLRIFLRRFLITEPTPTPRACLCKRLRSGRESYRNQPATRAGPTLRRHVLHGRPRGAAPPHPQVPRERGAAPPRGVGGQDLPRLDLPPDGRA